MRPLQAIKPQTGRNSILKKKQKKTEIINTWRGYDTSAEVADVSSKLDSIRPYTAANLRRAERKKYKTQYQDTLQNHGTK